MEMYAVVTRGRRRSGGDARSVTTKSHTASDGEVTGEVRWLRSYVLDAHDTFLGTVGIYEATGPDAIRRYADQTGRPADEIIRLADGAIVRSGSEEAAA
jgi:hypothetical protein